MSSKTETTVEAREPTAEERELQQLQIQLARQQIEEFGRQREFQEQLGELVAPAVAEARALNEILTPEERAEVAREQFERERRLGPIQDELLQAELERIRRGGAASPEQLALIEEATERAITAGERDISRFRDESLSSIREELAPSLGLRPGDTPLIERGSDVANRAGELQQDLVTNLRAGQATAALNFPLAVDQQLSSQSNFQLERARAIEEFRTRLRESSLQARASLASQQGGGLIAGTGANISSGLNSLRNFRLQTATRSQSFTPGLGEFGLAFTQGVGAGLGSAAGGAVF